MKYLDPEKKPCFHANFTNLGQGHPAWCLLPWTTCTYGLLNAFHAAGEYRQQVKNLPHFVKNVNILEFGYYIWNPYEKCIKISTNMPGIGSSICEIDVKIVRNLIKANKLLLSKTSSRVLSVNTIITSLYSHSLCFQREA